MPTDKLDLVKKHLEAVTKSDWTTFRNSMADNVDYDEEATQRHVNRADQYVDIVKAWKAAFPDLKSAMKESVATGDAVVCEVEWSGTHKGTLTAPFGTIQPTNRAGKLPAALVYRFDGDRIRAVHHYFDLMTLLSQLGIMPKQAQPTAP